MSLQKLKTIDIVFENCEAISIPADMVYLHVTGVKSNMHSCNTAEFSETLTCDRVGIHILPEGAEYLKTCAYNSFNDRKAYDRVFKYSDITHVEYIFEDGSNKYISVPWKGSEYYNRLIDITKFVDHRGKDSIHISIANSFNLRLYIKYLWYRRYLIKYYYRVIFRSIKRVVG